MQYDRPEVSKLRKMLDTVREERDDLKRKLEEAEKNEGQAIDERDRFEAQILRIAVALGLSERDREWSNANDVGENCVERAEALEAQVTNMAEALIWARGEMFNGTLSETDNAVRIKIEEALPPDATAMLAEGRAQSNVLKKAREAVGWFKESSCAANAEGCYHGHCAAIDDLLEAFEDLDSLQRDKLKQEKGR